MDGEQFTVGTHPASVRQAGEEPLIFRGYAKCQPARGRGEGTVTGTWQVTSDLLAKARFVVSPKAEVVAALEALLRPSDPAERAFRAAHHVAFEAMLDEHPVRRDLISHSCRPRRGGQPGWLADFLASPPRAPDATFEAELADVAATPAGAAARGPAGDDGRAAATVA